MFDSTLFYLVLYSYSISTSPQGWCDTDCRFHVWTSASLQITWTHAIKLLNNILDASTDNVVDMNTSLLDSNIH